MSFSYANDSLLLYDPNRSRATTHVWIARPTSEEEQRLGKLFLVIAIDNHQRVNHDIIGIIQDELRIQYYQGQGLNPERQFEQALKHTNQRLHDLIADGVGDWLQQSHMIVGCIHPQGLTIAPVRQVHAFRLRRSRLDDMIGEPVLDLNPLRVFGETVSSIAEPGDRYLLCLPSLLDYFSLEKLRRSLLDHDPHEAARVLEQQVLGVDPSISFGALFFAYSDQPSTISSPVHLQHHLTDWDSSQPIPYAHRPANRPDGPQQSIDHLLKRQRATSQLLAPSVWPAIKNVLQGAQEGASRLFRTAILRRPPRRIVPAQPAPTPEEPQDSDEEIVAEAPTPMRRTSSPWVNRVAHFRHQFTNIFRAWKIPTSPFRRPRFHFGVSRGIRWWNQLQKRQRLIVTGGICLLIIFSASLFLNNRRQEPTTMASSLSTTEAQVALDEAEAALLYGGEAIARQALERATLAITALPKKSKTEKETADALTVRANAIESRIAKRVTAELTQLVQSVHQPKQLFLTPSSLTAYDAGNQRLDVVQLSSKQAVDRPITVDIGTPVTGAYLASNQTIVFLTDRREFAEYTPSTDSWRQMSATIPATTSFSSITTFQTRLYALNTASNDITRFTRSPATYSSGTSWLRATAELSSARQIVVDGSIFVLQEGATVENYFSGRKTDFTLKSVTPPLTTITRIWTDADAKYLYIIDDTGKRLVVFDKNGAFIRQYAHDSWSELRDLAINEVTKTGYVLHGQTVSSFPLTDLTF